jgi:hypothetical protein
VAGIFVDQGNNLIGISDGATGFTTSTLIGSSAAPIDPLLAPLGNYGGLTQTIALLPGSRAIDAGNSALPTDQRGMSTIEAGPHPLTPSPEGEGEPDSCSLSLGRGLG